MGTSKSSASAHPSTRKKARTNRGMFGSLERQERFEALIYALRTLYKAHSY